MINFVSLIIRRSCWAVVDFFLCAIDLYKRLQLDARMLRCLSYSDFSSYSITEYINDLEPEPNPL